MRTFHKLGPYDGRRFASSSRDYMLSEIEDPQAILVRLAPLLASQDPEDRRDAERLVYLLGRAVYCPNGVWVCKSRYAIVPSTGKRWSDSEIIWSAHLTKSNAQAWFKFWVQHFRREGRTDYEWLPVVQQDRVPLCELVHPDAEVGKGVG